MQKELNGPKTAFSTNSAGAIEHPEAKTGNLTQVSWLTQKVAKTGHGCKCKI